VGGVVRVSFFLCTCHPRPAPRQPKLGAFFLLSVFPFSAKIAFTTSRRGLPSAAFLEERHSAAFVRENEMDNVPFPLIFCTLGIEALVFFPFFLFDFLAVPDRGFPAGRHFVSLFLYRNNRSSLLTTTACSPFVRSCEPAWNTGGLFFFGNPRSHGCLCLFLLPALFISAQN